MKNTFITVIILLCMSNITKGQVGINTESPKATLHVEKVSDLKFSDGIIPPRISGDSLM